MGENHAQCVKITHKNFAPLRGDRGRCLHIMKCKDCCAYMPGSRRPCGAIIIPGHKCQWGKEKVDGETLQREKGGNAKIKQGR